GAKIRGGADSSDRRQRRDEDRSACVDAENRKTPGRIGERHCQHCGAGKGKGCRASCPEGGRQGETRRRDGQTRDRTSRCYRKSQIAKTAGAAGGGRHGACKK